jgi:hypothetical protein
MQPLTDHSKNRPFRLILMTSFLLFISFLLMTGCPKHDHGIAKTIDPAQYGLTQEVIELLRHIENLGSQASHSAGELADYIESENPLISGFAADSLCLQPGLTKTLKERLHQLQENRQGYQRWAIQGTLKELDAIESDECLYMQPSQAIAINAAESVVPDDGMIYDRFSKLLSDDQWPGFFPEAMYPIQLDANRESYLVILWSGYYFASVLGVYFPHPDNADEMISNIEESNSSWHFFLLAKYIDLLAISDFDNNGTDDILVYHALASQGIVDGENSLYIYNGAQFIPVFTEPVSVSTLYSEPPLANSSRIFLQDLDGDAMPEIIVTRFIVFNTNLSFSDEEDIFKYYVRHGFFSYNADKKMFEEFFSTQL